MIPVLGMLVLMGVTLFLHTRRDLTLRKTLEVSSQQALQNVLEIFCEKNAKEIELPMQEMSHPDMMDRKW